MVRFAFFVSFLFVVFLTCVMGQYDHCTGQHDQMGDGECNMDNNNEECGYDGGDCCECSCTIDRIYPCGILGFNCTDPVITGNEGDCHNKTEYVRNCLSDAPVTLLVSDTASAVSLAEAVNCSGGTFSVTWMGSVFVNRTFYIPNNTTLYVTGDGSGAEVNGGGRTRLFMASGADLHIEGLILKNGNATYGGAIAARRSAIFLNQTVFSGNTASNYGGAINVGIASILVWKGKTILTGNYAGYNGGAVAIMMNSVVSWDGEASFFCNMAKYGGALYISRGSIVSWDRNTSFVNNTVNSAGGALFIDETSFVSWDGNTSFIGNTAIAGGAVYISSYSRGSWDGKTSFVGNMASYAGALYIASHSNVSWDGETSFVNNTASYDGGALEVATYCTVSWSGVTSFVNNTASVDGGALWIFSHSSVSWDGETSFVGNTAKNDGGALNIFWYSSVSWNGETSFTENIACSNGGTIYIKESSNISVGGDTRFVDNEAGVDGGAAYIYVGYDDETSSYMIFRSNSAVLFQGNACGGNGGAIAFIGEVVTRFSENMTFLKNTAEVSGGAIYMSGVTIGMRFERMVFKSNSAVIGGGLYSTGSGTAITEDDHGDPIYNSTYIIGCEFVGNTAVKTGGAMDSGAGSDWIENTSFVGNTGWLGGALRLVGTTSLIGCDFVNNLSGEDNGPGVSNDGVISDLSNCNFVGNAFNCQTGLYLDYNDTDDLFDTVCKGCDTLCSGCIVKDKEPICLEELEDSHSMGGNTTLESLLIERGYWRATNTSMDILACYNTDACLGGVTGDQGYCSEGYEGPYCSVCSKNYTASLGFACNKCSDNAAGGIALAVVMAVVILLVPVAFLYYMLSGETEGADQRIVARVARFIPLQSVKIVIVVWQILTQFSTVANVVFPGVYQTFLDGVDILNFDLSWVLSIGCMIDTDFHDQLLLATLGPLVCMAILGGTYIAAIRRNRSSEEDRGKVRRKHVSMVLLLTFLVYSSVSSTLFKTFACDNLDDGKNYLRADYRIECDSSKHNVLEIYAGFMVILYVVGIPALYGVLLYTNRKALMNNTEREEDGSIKPITDLWKPYRPERYFYEVVECVRRVLLTGALVFIYPNTAGQIAVALVIATFFMIVSEALAPLSSPWDTWISRTGHAIVYSSLFVALLLKVDVTGEHASSQKAFELVLVAAHSCLILVVVIQAVVMVMASKKEVKEYPIPRMRRGYSQGVGKGGVFLEDEAPPSYEDLENEKRHPNQVMGQSQTAASKNIDMSLAGGQC